jgi:protoheme IX farnesyltransferase
MPAVSILKPRIVGLFAFTELAAMLLAGPPGAGLVVAVLAATAAVVAGAAALNNVLERDTDARMRRTRRRPTAAGTVRPAHALALGLALAAAGVTGLWLAAGPLAGVLALAGLLYYVVAYTLVFKPRTALSAVPGAVAGVFPALVGWAAAGAPPSLGVAYLCAVIVIWSPPHFWALAFVVKDEYAAAGIPVPVACYGERRSALQILEWVVALAALTALPAAAGVFGPLYAAVALAAGLVLAFVAWRLAATRTPSWAWALYKLSGPYLATVVLAMLADRHLQDYGLLATLLR